jgi:hypothetical protein
MERNSLIEGPRWPVRDRFTELNFADHHGCQNGGIIDLCQSIWHTTQADRALQKLDEEDGAYLGRPARKNLAALEA